MLLPSTNTAEGDTSGERTPTVEDDSYVTDTEDEPSKKPMFDFSGQSSDDESSNPSSPRASSFARRSMRSRATAPLSPTYPSVLRRSDTAPVGVLAAQAICVGQQWLVSDDSMPATIDGYWIYLAENETEDHIRATVYLRGTRKKFESVFDHTALESVGFHPRDSVKDCFELLMDALKARDESLTVHIAAEPMPKGRRSADAFDCGHETDSIRITVSESTRRKTRFFNLLLPEEEFTELDEWRKRCADLQAQLFALRQVFGLDAAVPLGKVVTTTHSHSGSAAHSAWFPSWTKPKTPRLKKKKKTRGGTLGSEWEVAMPRRRARSSRH